MSTHPNDLLDLLRQALNDPQADFREGQQEAIRALVDRNERLLVVQRTGWGKSMVYFIATTLLRQRGNGPTLLISPLLALMRNQVEAARRLGLTTERIDSTNEASWSDIETAIRANQVDLLLISPERLNNPRFIHNVLQPIAGQVGMLVVDEAHCISDWGHDFRPDYLRIVRILRNLPANISVLATTATANDRVVEDVVGQIPGLTAQRGSLVRTSLRLQTIRMHDLARRLAWLTRVLPTIEGCGIVYVLTTKDADRVADWLSKNGINVKAYHGGSDGREELEQDLLFNRIKAVVATSALGMGFDKPDLAFVIHFQRPDSPVTYYQQVGRAGRALESALGILLEGAEDDDIIDWLIHSNELHDDHVEQILNALEQHDEPVSMAQLEARVNLRRGKMMHVLKLLHAQPNPPVDRDGTRWVRTLHPYQPDHQRIEQLRLNRLAERDRMKAYIDGTQCLMEFLQRELNDPSAAPCGRCAVCRGQSLVSLEIPERAVTAAQDYLGRQHIPIKPRKQWQPSALPDMAPKNQRIPLDEQMKVGIALCRWGDPVYGERIKRGKQVDRFFDDELVDALAVRIQAQQYDPFPTVVTWVPSLRSTMLVPEFAQRLAQRLGLPAVDCVTKIRETAQQKRMQNSYTQMQNLNGAFSILNGVPLADHHVLLVDDLVDSRWTFTLVAALLRRAGAASVRPVALANTESTAQ